MQWANHEQASVRLHTPVFADLWHLESGSVVWLFGLKGCIGKGERSRECMQALAHYGAHYFLATGGAGALISACIQSAKIVADEDLGIKVIRELEVENMRLVLTWI